MCTMFFVFIFNSFGIDKYLYLGHSDDCDAVGNEAFLDKPINNNQKIICSKKFPYVDYTSFDPRDVTLYIILNESGIYKGIENLIYFPQMIIQKQYTEESISRFETESIINDILLFPNITVTNGLDLEIYTFGTYTPITLKMSFSSSEHVKLINVIALEIFVSVDKNYNLDDSYKTYGQAQITFSGSNKIIDMNQVLNGKIIILDGPDFEYKGNNGYYIPDFTYTGIESIKRTNINDPKIVINSVKMMISGEITIKSFIDATVDSLYILSSSPSKIIIDTESTIHLPIYQVIGVEIISNKKIDIDEGSIIESTKFIDLNIFSGKTNQNKPLKVLYQIIDMPYACIFSEDISDTKFANGFLDYYAKTIVTNGIKNVTIPSSHFKGLTDINNINLICSDSNCKIDAIVDPKSGKLLNNEGIELNPEFFTVLYQDDNFIFNPMKNNVTEFNDFSNYPLASIKLKKYSKNDQKTFYKLDFDVHFDSIEIDDNIDIQFDCNLMLDNPIKIPSTSSIIDSPKSGALIMINDDSIVFDKIAQTYQRKTNKIYFIYYGFLVEKNIYINNLSSDNDELNTINIFINNINRGKSELYLNKITACKGVNVFIHVSEVYISENTISIDKQTLLPNPQFTSAKYLSMGTSDNVYYHQDYNTLQIMAKKYSSLYLCGNIRFINTGSTNKVEIKDVFYIKGSIIQNDNLEFVSKNLISSFSMQTYSPRINVENAIYTTNLDFNSEFENIMSPKLVLSGLSSNQDITINGQKINIKEKETNHEIDTMKFEKIVMYLPHNNIVSPALFDEQGNIVKLNVGDSNEVHRVIDFNIIYNDDEAKDKSKNSLLKFVLNEKMKTSNSKFNGSFGYSFDEGLVGNVIFKEGETGEEKKQSPNYFPIEKVQMEPFPIDNPNSDKKQEKKKGLSKGAIVGIVIAAVVVVAIIIIVVIIILKRRNMNLEYTKNLKTSDISLTDQ